MNEEQRKALDEIEGEMHSIATDLYHERKERIDEAVRLLRRANSAHDGQLNYIRVLVLQACRVLEGKEPA